MDPFGGLFGLSHNTRVLVEMWKRVDGAQACLLGTKTWGMRKAGCKPEDPWQVARDVPDGWATAEGALAWIDREYPLTAPPPMGGQVWAWPGGEERVVGKVYGRAFGGAVLTNGIPPLHEFSASEWPPPKGILIGGPTPWGRDVPWAPEEITEGEDTP